MKDLLQANRNAPKDFQATSYWASYEERILETIESIELSQLRSGKYTIIGSFGFNDVIFDHHPNWPLWKKFIIKLIHQFIFRGIIQDRPFLPYSLKLSDIQEMAYHHCELMASITNARPLSSIEVSTFGNPQDLFEINGGKFLMAFLGYYLRYCFSQKHIGYKGNEIVVELGSGSGYQIEILKKLYPNITVLCFDLPAQIYLCEKYLTQAIVNTKWVGTEATLKWNNLSGIQKGEIHFFGNWQIPLLRDFPFDVFWNAASFGEMEPEIVENYLQYIKGNAKWIYLLQARHGKETTGKAHVQVPTTLDDYQRLLSGYVLQEEHNAWLAHRRFSQSGGYFEGIWVKK